MPSINIQAPVDQVFEAMSDLTRHGKWAAHDLEINAVGDGPAQVGSEYTCAHKGKPADQVTITDIVPQRTVRLSRDHAQQVGASVEYDRQSASARDHRHPPRQDYENAVIDDPHETPGGPGGTRAREKVSQQHED